MPVNPGDFIIGPSRGNPEGWFTTIDANPNIIDKGESSNGSKMSTKSMLLTICRTRPSSPHKHSWKRAILRISGGGSEKNAGSLGVTGDPNQNAASPTFKTTMASARAMSAHDLLYATGQIDKGGLKPADDPRYTAYRDAYGSTAHPLLSDLSGKYAADTNYAETIASRAKTYLPDLPNQSTGGTTVSIVYGNVPYPDVIKSHFPTSSPWIGSGAPAILEAVVWHRMVGTWAGSNSWGQAGNFATAYGVSVKATDGTGGKIYEWIAPNSGLYGESSGPVNAPYGDGLALVNKVGVSSVNRTTKAIEISGNYDTPLDNDAKQAVAGLTAYFADQKHIPWDQFPAIPGENRSFVVWHQEITIGTGKVCPGQVVMDATPEMIEMTANMMKQYQERDAPVPEPKPTPQPTPKPSKYAAPITYPWLTADDGKVHKVGTTRVLPLTLTYTATRSTPRYQKGSKQSDKIGPNIAKGTQFAAGRVFRSDEGVTFVLTPHASRVLASALLPRVSVTASGRISIRHEANDAPTVISDNVEGTP
jgi:hypothetical protein